MDVGVVHAGGRDVVQLLRGAGLRLGDVDDVEGLGPPKRVICRARRQVRLGPALLTHLIGQVCMPVRFMHRTVGRTAGRAT
jgi:hypothetical protein